MKAKSAVPVGIAHWAYSLPAQSLSLQELAARRLILSRPEQFGHLGFRRVFVSDRETAYDLARNAVRKVLRAAAADPAGIDAVIYASALPPDPPARGSDPAHFFRYPATALQHEFQMIRANVVGLSQAGCVSFLSALRMASAMIRSEPAVRRVLCVSADVLPRNSRREVLYNLISDGAAAALVERNCRRNRIVAYKQVTKGYFWDPENKGEEIVASYFATARHVIREALAEARLGMPDISMVLPHNVNRRSWDVLRQLLDIPADRLFAGNISRKGHTIAADNAINLCDARKAGKIKPGDYLLLFTFGFGAHWACTILRH